MRQGHAILLALALGGMVAAGAGGCTKERGLEPIDSGVAAAFVSIYTYINGDFFSQLYAYDPDTITLLDSFPVAALDVFASHAPTEIVVTLMDPVHGDFALRVAAINTETGAERHISSNVGWATTISGGALIVQGRASQDDASVVDTRTGNLVNVIPGARWFGASNSVSDGMVFTSLGNPATGVDDTLLVLVNARTGDTNGLFSPRLSNGRAIEIYRTTLHPDGHSVVLTGYAPGAGSCAVLGDMSTGQTLMASKLTHLSGDIAISPNGYLAAVSDAGDSFWGGPRYVDLFDLQSRTRVARMDPSSGLPGRSIGQLLFLSDSTLLSAPFDAIGHEGQLALIDLRTLMVLDTITLPYTDTTRGTGSGVLSMALGHIPAQ